MQIFAMLKQPVKLLVFFLLLAFYGSMLVHQIDLPYGNDVSRHVKNGELLLHGHTELLYTNFYSYTSPTLPVVNHHWMSGLVFYLVIATTGWKGLVIFKAIVLLLAFALLFIVAARKSDFWLASVLSIPAIFLLAERTQVRPEMLSVLFASLFIYLLHRFESNPREKKIYWLIPLQVLWVNSHIFFILGPAITGAFLVEKIIKREMAFIKKTFILILSLGAACLVNPNGIAGALAPFHIMGQMAFDVVELQPLSYFLKNNPMSVNYRIVIFAIALVILTLSFITGLRRKNIFYFILSAVAAFGTIKMVRIMPLFAVAFLPAAAANLASLFHAGRRQTIFSERFIPKLRTGCSIVFILILCSLIYYSASGRILDKRVRGLGLTAQSQNAAEFFKTNNLKGPLFNDYDIGEYLIYNLYPQERVFTDGRPEAYTKDFWKNIFWNTLSSESNWQQSLQKYKFNCIFFEENDVHPWAMQFIANRVIDSTWSLVFADKYAIIFLRNTAENQKTISQYSITPENVQQRMQPLLTSDDYEDQAAAADILSLVGRPDLGIAASLDIVTKWPDKGNTWKVMGQMELQAQGGYNAILAMMFLDKAISTGWKTTDAYTSLAEAYLKLGKKDKAEEALQKVLKINPDYRDAKEMLKKVKQ
jgi:tetratricopeptide (TPR) repeat protein